MSALIVTRCNRCQTKFWDDFIDKTPCPICKAGPKMSRTYFPYQEIIMLEGTNSTARPESQTQKDFRVLHATMLRTFLTKNTAYGDSYKKRGYIGVLTRLEDKIARIDSLVAKGLNTMGDESLIDTHMDAAVYNLLAVLCLQEEAAKRVPERKF